MKFYRLFLVLVAASLSLLWLAASTAQATDVNLAFLPAGGVVLGVPSMTSTASATPCSGVAGVKAGEIVNGVCDDVIVGDRLVFGVDFQVDAAGVNGWEVDLDWDSWDTGLQNSLTLDGVAPVASFYRGFENPSPPPTMIGYTVSATGDIQQSSPTQSGYVYTVSGGMMQDLELTIANTSFRAGTVTFSVNGTAETQISLGFFSPYGSSMLNSDFQFITPSFGVFQIGSVPEPGTSLLMGAGLFGLLIAGRSSRIRRSVGCLTRPGERPPASPCGTQTACISSRITVSSSRTDASGS